MGHGQRPVPSPHDDRFNGSKRPSLGCGANVVGFHFTMVEV